MEQQYYNHLTGEKRVAQRKKFAGAVGKKHDFDLSAEQNPDTKPLGENTFSNLLNAKEAEGSMLFMNEPDTNGLLMKRGNTVEQLQKFYTDIITTCEKFGVALTPKFGKIKKDLEI